MFDNKSLYWLEGHSDPQGKETVHKLIEKFTGILFVVGLEPSLVLANTMTKNVSEDDYKTEHHLR